MRLLLRRLCPVLCVVGLTVSTAVGQGYSADEAAGRMTVPPGFSATLVASEPMVRQPVAIEFDDRGRMWVIQYLQYPNPAGLERVKWDRYSRTQYDRVPEPPPHGPVGADRITILEDTDGDGRADHAKDFVTGLNITSGITFGHGGVFVLNVPYLLFYPDRDRDDVPDGDPEVLLEGFGMEDCHSVANSLIFGPDGWLYGAQGSTVTADIRGIEFQQGVWRYHPLTKEFELFYEGGGNTWGVDFDAKGNLFASTNYGPYIMVHGVQGGYYWKSFGKHGALHNPYTYGYFDHVKQHDPRGGHVVDGGLVYQGDGFPASFRGKYIAANLLSHDVYYSSIMPKGSSFESQHAGELLLSNDTWFAPSDVAMGPDGSIYVTDWHDQRTAHPDPDAEWDRRNGRIYRIKADGTRPVGKLNLGAAPSDKLVEYLSHPNDWFARKARVELAARRDASVIATLKKTVRSSRDEHRVLQSLWALYVSGGFDESLARELCGNPSAAVRAWAVRLVGDARNVSRETAKRLIALAENDPSLRVRSQLASTAKRLPPADGLPICERILMRNEDGMDLHIPLLLWWAIEHHALNDVDGVLDRFASAEAWRAPMIREHILDRLTRRYAAEESDAGFAACARILESAPTAKDRLAMVAALGKGLKSSRLDRVPRALVTPIAALRKAHRSDVSVIRTAARLGSRSAYEQAVAWLSDEGSSVSTQVAMLGVLGDVYQPACIPVVLERIGNGAPEAVQLAALGALRRFDDPRILSALLARYSAMPAKARSAARDMFFGRRGWASAFLERLDAGAFDPKEVPADQLRQLAVHEDEELDAQVRKHWGRISRPSAGEKLAEVRRLNNDVRAKPGDPVKGHALYKARCAVCHRLYGEGNNVGPDLTQANRKDRNFLLVTLIDPSLTIRKEYTSYIVQTTDGRFLTGLIIEQTPSSITLAGNNDTRTTIARDAVEAMKESPISLMPEGLLKDLSPDQLRDLFAYLESDQPPAGVELIPGDLP